MAALTPEKMRLRSRANNYLIAGGILVSIASVLSGVHNYKLLRKDLIELRKAEKKLEAIEKTNPEYGGVRVKLRNLLRSNETPWGRIIKGNALEKELEKVAAKDKNLSNKLKTHDYFQKRYDNKVDAIGFSAAGVFLGGTTALIGYGNKRRLRRLANIRANRSFRNIRKIQHRR